ncbi:hypothetical protein OPT61_g9289 [Boeremia exigua]|uniref:Uncharacterized protein n=1 Tax=Boeremia exigua TaxID=749465 RepID=A0ACC2HUQ8_9PLEO|nr:hypothetical protein OPT61_g9289 [Boeremia exigua]
MYVSPIKTCRHYLLENTADNAERATIEAAEIYKRAAIYFSKELTQDERKSNMAQQTASLRDLELIVETARKGYESSRHQKPKKWLTRLFSRLMYYGNIFDVLAQHHPEYVALAWGAMKFLFVACLNHEGTVTSIAKGLARIADALPRVELATILYQTTKMNAAVEALYAHIIRFLIRAHDWYRESSLRHVLHSITRPAQLRYEDLLEEIGTCSRNIEQLAIAGSQVEIWQMNTVLQVMAERVERSESAMNELKQMITSEFTATTYKAPTCLIPAENQSLNSSSLVDTNQKVSDLQFSEMVRIAADPSSFDPHESYNQAIIVRNLRQRSRNQALSAFWHCAELKKLADAPSCSLMLVRSTFQERRTLRDTAVTITEELKRRKIPNLWAIGAQNLDTNTKAPAPNDILRSLIAQALVSRDSAHTQKSTALNCAQLHTTTTQKQRFDILGAALASICQQTYILLELESLVSLAGDNTPADELIEIFENLFRELQARGTKPIVKVLVFTCRPMVALPRASANVLVAALPGKSSSRVRQPLKHQRKKIRLLSTQRR